MRGFLAFLLIGLALSTAPAFAAGDHDRARDAVQAGDALPLGQVLRQVRRQHPGRLLDANLRQGAGGRLIYELRILAPDGAVRRLSVDAQNARVLGVR
jgi:uncharacterized membrane protein YkoI